MSNVALTIRTDTATKQQIASFATSIGLSTSGFMLAAAMQAVRDRRILLAPILEPTPYLEKIMRKAKADRKAGRNISPIFDNVDDMLDYMDKNST